MFFFFCTYSSLFKKREMPRTTTILTLKMFNREAELGGDSELFIGPPPPAMVKEAESSNEAERFEEVLSSSVLDYN